MEGVSIIICCYNSSARISKTLGFLAKQIVPISIPWEVLIVDNNCNDNTVEIASKEWCKYNLETKLKIVYQPQSGLSYARQKGVEISSFDYVIFCDDDNWLNENYIEIAYRILNSNKSISALGGKIKAVADVDFPDFWSKFSEHFAVGNQLPQTGFANQRKYLWGAGLTMRKYDYLCVSRQESLLQDRKGKELSSGGDSEICARLLLFGKDLYYSDKLELQHYIATERLSEAYLSNLMKGHNESFRVIEKYWKIIDITNISFLDKLIKTFNQIYSLNIFKRKFLVELFLLWNIPFFIDNEFKTILNIKKLKNKN